MATKDYIVMLPFMGQGHLIPILDLAKKLIHFRIIIANTPLNINYLRSAINSSSSLTTKIRFLELPFCSTDHGLPPGTENSDNLSSEEEIGRLIASSDTLKTPFLEALYDVKIQEDGRTPLCIISDGFFGWANDVAEIIGTVNLSFSASGAYGSLAYLSICQNLPHLKSGSNVFYVPGFPKHYRFHSTQMDQLFRETDGTDPGYEFMVSLLSSTLKSYGWLCNTVEEIEPLGLKCLREYTKLPIWSIGPLLPPAMLSDDRKVPNPSLRGVGKKHGISTEECLEWLDLQKVCSVLYVSFGSQNNINPEQMMELATGLENSGSPFIWVIRAPAGFNRKSEFRAEWLPERFEERISTTKQGLLVGNWAPQLEILSHESTGAFLSHCGWNSVMESLSQGVPIIGWPLAAEQGYNSKMLVEEMRVSVELGRGLESKVGSERVKDVVEMVMDVEGQGGEMRKKAMEIGKLMKDSVKEKGSSVNALHDFVTTLLSRKA